MHDDIDVATLPPVPDAAGGLWVLNDTTQSLDPVPVESPAGPDVTPSEE